MSLALLKWVWGDWNASKAYLRQDLDAIQERLNRVGLGGITELIDDVLAGPGDGQQSATVAGCPLTDLGNSGMQLTVDFRGRRFGRFYFTQTADCTLVFQNPTNGGAYFFVIKSGGFALTWPTAVCFPDDTAPTMSSAGKHDLVTLQYIQKVPIYIGSFNLNYGH